MTMRMSKEFFIKRFDTSLLQPTVSDENVTSFIKKCKGYTEYFAAIGFHPHQISLAVKLLKDTDIRVIMPIAYPLDCLPTELKVAEARYAVERGALQIDMSMELDAFKSGKYDLVKKDIAAVASAVKGKMKHISVIPDTAYLTNEEKICACKIIRDAGGDTVKTNSGFGLVTTVEEVRLMKRELGDTIEIMASGGVRTVEQALAMFEAGADRVATSTPFRIFEGLDRLLRWLK
jgi:deoxyribose-phosphate aldolase